MRMLGRFNAADQVRKSQAQREEMRMFNKKFKLIGQAIGLVAVLVLLLTVPGVTQQEGLPTRSQIVQGLEQALAVTLVAAEGDIFHTDAAAFVSLPQLGLAYIPLHPSSRSAQLWNAWLEAGEPFGDSINIGALYLENDMPGHPDFVPLNAGTYHLKVTKSLRVIAVDPMGNESLIGAVNIRPRGSTEENPFWKWVLIVCIVSDPSVTVTVGDVSVTVGC
jgi:hypothetical protein